MKCKLFIPAEHYLKVENILEGSPLIPLRDNKGNIINMDYVGDNLDISKQLLDEIAPCVKDGSYIEETGDYNDQPIRWAFHGSQCYKLRPQIIWPEPWDEKKNDCTVAAKITPEQIKLLKETYHPGVTIRLISMYEEPQMPFGMMGKTTFVDDAGQIHVTWENGSTLALNCEVDKFIAFTGPTASEYLRGKLGLIEGTKTWYRNGPSGQEIAAVDNDSLTSAAERYMEKIIGMSQDLAIATCKLYQTETIFDAFLSAHVLTDEDVQSLKRKTDYTKDESEANHCPKCGGDALDFNSYEVVDTYVEYPWTCKKCGSTGKEYGAIVFDGHIVETYPDNLYSPEEDSK